MLILTSPELTRSETFDDTVVAFRADISELKSPTSDTDTDTKRIAMFLRSRSLHQQKTSLICVWCVGFTTKDLGDVRSMDSEKCDSSKTGLTMEY